MVYKGGQSLIDKPLIHVFVDGKRVRARLQAKVYRTDQVNLRGFRVFARLPRGRHTIELKPGKPVWVKRKRVKGRIVPGHWR